MYKSNELIDSETFDKLKQEIHNNIINSSNENEVLLKLKELKNLSVDELRGIIPWGIIKKEIDIKQIFFSWITDSFINIKRKITRNKNKSNNYSFQFSTNSLEEVYNLTYKYYLKSTFDNINNNIKDTLNKYKRNYVYLYPHEGALEVSGQENDSYRSKETKRLEAQEKILGLFKVASWVIPIAGLFKLIDINIDLFIKVIMWFSVYISFNALYNIYNYYIKICKQVSVYRDNMTKKIKEIIDSELQPELTTRYILDEFHNKVVKKINKKDTKNYKYIKIASIAITIILIIVLVSPSFNNATAELFTSEPNSSNLSDEPEVTKEDVEKYLKAKGTIPLISEEPMPEEEIKFVKEKITGKISSVTMNLSLDCTSIKVKTIDEKGNVKVDATISPKINAKGWEITKGTLFDLNENNTLKENYKDGLYSEILAIYQSKENVISVYNEIKKRTENAVKDEIDGLINNQYLGTYKLDEVRINYETIEIDMSNTDLK